MPPEKPASAGASANLATFEGEIVDGLWLIEIDKLVSIRELVRFPGGGIRVENGKSSFDCQLSDIVVLGKVITRTEYL